MRASGIEEAEQRRLDRPGNGAAIEGVEDVGEERLQAGRERKRIGHPQSMLDLRACRKMVSASASVSPGAAAPPPVTRFRPATERSSSMGIRPL